MEFEQARELVQTGAVRPGGIGILTEKALHATLKLWLDEDSAHHEQTLPCGCVADIFDGQRVTEIQTANFSGFRTKLARLLEHHPVTVVHPLVRRKWLRWVDPTTGQATEPRRSPRMGSFTDAGAQLVFILPYLTHPNLTVRLVLLDVEEHRLADGWSRDGKRGSHRVERYPLSLVDTLTLSAPADYRELVPPGLPTPFTAAQFGKVAHLQGRKLSATLKVLLELGVLTREKVGREYQYRVNGE